MTYARVPAVLVLLAACGSANGSGGAGKSCGAAKAFCDCHATVQGSPFVPKAYSVPYDSCFQSLENVENDTENVCIKEPQTSTCSCTCEKLAGATATDADVGSEQETVGGSDAGAGLDSGASDVAITQETSIEDSAAAAGSDGKSDGGSNACFSSAGTCVCDHDSDCPKGFACNDNHQCYNPKSP